MALKEHIQDRWTSVERLSKSDLASADVSIANVLRRRCRAPAQKCRFHERQLLARWLVCDNTSSLWRDTIEPQVVQLESASYADTVSAFGLEPSIRELIISACSTLGVHVCETDCRIDLIAVPAMLIAVNPHSMGKEDLAEVLAWFADVQDPDVRFLFTGSVESIPGCLAHNTIAIPPEWSHGFFKFLIMRRRSVVQRRHRQVRSYDRKLLRLFFVLNELSTNRAARTKDLAQELNVSVRTMQRDITLLQMTGECIDYDGGTRAYTVPSGWSPSWANRG